jgi:hypothetical protein
VDPAFFLLPPPSNPILGRFTAPVYERHRRYPNAGFICYLPVSALVAALVGVARTRRSRPWAALLIAALVLSMGATVYWMGRPVPGVPMPFGLVERIPILNLAREANNMMVLAGLALAVLAGLGWASLGRTSRPAFALACAVVLLECSVTPYAVREVKIPEYIESLGRGGLPGAVLDIPFSADGRLVQNMAYQVSHGRPIAGGYLSIVPDAVKNALGSDRLLRPLAGFAPRLKADCSAEDFRSRGFGYVILHKNRIALASRIPERRRPSELVPLAVYETLRRELEAALGPAAFEDERLLAFEVPGAQVVLPTAAATRRAAKIKEPRTPSPARRPSRDRS